MLLKTRGTVVLWAVCWPLSVFAVDSGEPSDSQPVEQVIVISTHQPRRIEDEPMRVEVIGPEELNEKVATSPGDVSMLLNETSDLHVQMTSPGLGAANVRIDGLRRTQPLVLPQRAPHGRWTVDAWGPLDGRVVNLALRWRFGGGESP